MCNPKLLKKTAIMAILLAVAVAITSADKTCRESVLRDPPETCPTWHYNISGECACGYEYKKAIKCYFPSTSKLETTFCSTFDDTSNLTYIGACPYTKTPKHLHLLFAKLPENVLKLNDYMCGPLNRTGLLCSQCQDGLGPAVLSPYRECLECMDEPYGWILYFFMAIIPQTLFCLLVIIFRINVASPYLNGFVLAAQIILNLVKNTPGNVVHEFVAKLIATCYGFLNLDFLNYVLPSFCIKPGMSTLTVIALEYTVALYPIFFTVVVYYGITLHDNGCRILMFCWRPFRWVFAKFRQTWQLKGSVINAFATFLLLSYSKLCTISFSLLQYSSMCDICGNVSHGRVYYDASLTALSTQHIPYVILASTVIIIFICLPALFVLFYQNKWFQKCLNCCKFKCVLIHELANICQGSFKNGISPGTRDYRWFAGVYLLMRIFLVVLFNLRYYQLVYIILLAIITILLTFLRPYKNESSNKLDSLMWITFMVGTSWHFYTVAYEDISPQKTYIFYALPIIYMMCLLAWKVVAYIVAKCRSRFPKRKKVSNSGGKEDSLHDDQLPYRLTENTPLLSSANNCNTLNSDKVDMVNSDGIFIYTN